MATKEAKARATAKYEAKVYDKVLIRMKAGQKETIQAHADAKEESLNGFINRAIEETIKRDKDETIISHKSEVSLQLRKINNPESELSNEFNPTLLSWK